MLPPKKLIGELVQRTRSGDQIARSLLSEINYRSRLGDKRSIQIKKMFESYIQANPIKDKYNISDIQIIRPNRWELYRPAVQRIGRQLADKCYLLSYNGRANPNVIKIQTRIAAGFGSEGVKTFQSAVLAKDIYKCDDVNGRIGSAVKFGIKLQAVREKMNKINLFNFSPAACWELY